MIKTRTITKVIFSVRALARLRTPVPDLRKPSPPFGFVSELPARNKIHTYFYTYVFIIQSRPKIHTNNLVGPFWLSKKEH